MFDATRYVSQQVKMLDINCVYSTIIENILQLDKAEFECSKMQPILKRAIYNKHWHCFRAQLHHLFFEPVLSLATFGMVVYC